MLGMGLIMLLGLFVAVIFTLILILQQFKSENHSKRKNDEFMLFDDDDKMDEQEEILDFSKPKAKPHLQ